ncbi:hypothetical protein WJX84_001903 [Apatococcus fuscideae]|uniref:Uncharacterized protein n=1 Tax=Apatococcus fuscideae TaxID=2026836 RepID=A0AAW1T7V3_9CHLO
MAPSLAGNTGEKPLTLTGRWKKDSSRSDKMDKGMDLIQLGWALRKGMVMVTALLIEDTPDHFATLVEALGFFKVREQYPWTGEMTHQKRRDMREGQTTGNVTRGKDGSATVEISWDNPHAGSSKDTFTLSADGQELVQTSLITIISPPDSCETKTVYKRAS